MLIRPIRPDKLILDVFSGKFALYSLSLFRGLNVVVVLTVHFRGGSDDAGDSGEYY